MIANLLNKNIVRILSYLLISPGSRHSRKEIKEKTGMNNITLDESLHTLENIGILTRKRRLYELNMQEMNENSILKDLKNEFETFAIPHRTFNILVEFTGEMLKEKSIEGIILFGSYAKLIFSEKSDIDVALITKEKNKRIENEANKKTKGISEKWGKTIETHFFTKEEFKKKDLIIADIKKNGKILAERKP